MEKQSTILQTGQAVKNSRNSAIELTKILAIFCIIGAHVVATMGNENPYVSYQAYRLPLGFATRNFAHWLLSLLGYGGTFGNYVFFVCTAWFLLDRKNTRGGVKKLCRMEADIYLVSLLCLLTALPLVKSGIPIKLLLDSLLPSLTASNWYLSCYMLFYAIHPLLNKVVFAIDRSELLKLVVAMDAIYLCMNFVHELLFPSYLLLWMALYFTVAYIKLYLKDLSADKRVNATAFLAGILGQVLAYSLVNALGFRIAFFQDKVGRMGGMYNPFLALAAISLFNLARTADFHNRGIDRLANLSMLIYIIHENILVRTYFRPWLLNDIYTRFGYDFLLLLYLILVIGIFTASVCAGALYKKLFKRAADWFGDAIYGIAKAAYSKAAGVILTLH